MKLIIDIPEDLYKWICEQYANSNHEVVYNAVKNGMPYEERPQGEWGKWAISEIRCPNCLEYFQTDCYSTEELKKCPNCGAKMKGD